MADGARHPSKRRWLWWHQTVLLYSCIPPVDGLTMGVVRNPWLKPISFSVCQSWGGKPLTRWHFCWSLIPLRRGKTSFANFDPGSMHARPCMDLTLWSNSISAKRHVCLFCEGTERVNESSLVRLLLVLFLCPTLMPSSQFGFARIFYSFVGVLELLCKFGSPIFGNSNLFDHLTHKSGESPNLGFPQKIRNGELYNTCGYANRAKTVGKEMRWWWCKGLAQPGSSRSWIWLVVSFDAIGTHRPQQTFSLRCQASKSIFILVCLYTTAKKPTSSPQVTQEKSPIRDQVVWGLRLSQVVWWLAIWYKLSCSDPTQKMCMAWNWEKTLCVGSRDIMTFCT